MKGYSENQTNSLNDKQIQTFQNQGYLAIERLIDTSDLDLLIHVISDLRQESAFDKRWYEILQQFNGQNEVYGWHKTVFGKPLFDLITHEAVLDVVGSLTDGEIQFNGDFWVRPKLPLEKLTALPLIL